MGHVVHASSIASPVARVLIAILSLVTLGAAPTLPSGFSYEADAECPTAVEFRKILSGSLEPLPELPNLSVKFAREPGGFRGRLTVQRSELEPLERQVLAPSCSEAAEAIGIVIEQMASTHFRELAVAKTAATPTPVSSAKGPTGADPAPRRSQPEVMVERSEAYHAAQLHGALGVGASVRSVLPPGERLGAIGFLSFDWPGVTLHPELSVLARWHMPGAADTESGRVNFRWWALELNPSVLLHRLTRTLTLRGGLAIAYGRLSSQGQGFAGAKTVQSSWLSVTPGMMLCQQMSSRWHLTLSTGLDVPIVGAEVVAEGRGVVFRSAHVGVVSDLRVKVRF